MIDFAKLHAQVATHHKLARKAFHVTHKHAKRLLKKHRLPLEELRHHSIKTVAAAAMVTGAFSGPAYAFSNQPEQLSDPQAIQQVVIADQAAATGVTVEATTDAPAGPDASLANKAGLFTKLIDRVVPNPSSALTGEQESQLEQLIKDNYGVPAKVELEGIRLNTTYGVMAGEQHLPLYPGDTLENHSSDPTKHLTGMVPGLPSWGYFAQSKAEVTQKDIERERYYIAAQTFLSPGWNQNVQKYYQWYKYRKMIVVNPETGQACVVVIGDAGPSPFLKRSFGGSNEVMIHVGLGLKRKGAVYALFVDDPNDTIPLGPIGGQP
ncbi:hypothetical protein BH11PAT4_BH11PAT4_6910 [soil metagenome]